MRRTLVPDVSSFLLGANVPWARKKGAMKFSLLWESLGKFCILVVFEKPATRGRIYTKFYLYRDNVCRRAFPAVGYSGPWGRVER